MGLVYDIKYRTIEDKDKSKLTIWDSSKIMAKFEVRRGLSGTWSKVTLVFAGFILFGFLSVMNLIIFLPADEFWDGVQSNVSFLVTPMDGPGGLILIHVAVVASGIIASDLKDRAIDLYLTKMNFKAYYISKIIAAMSLTVISMPLAGLIYLIVAFYKRWPSINEYGMAFELLAKTILAVFLITLFFSVLILVFSSLTSNSINAGIMFFVFLLVARVIFVTVLYKATDINIFYTMSPLNSIDIIRRMILAPGNKSDKFGTFAVIFYVIYMISGLVFVYWRLRKETRG